jgi:hypothetical protein
MSTQLEHRESHKEVQQKESQQGTHAANEAIEAYKPQAKTEKHQAKEEPKELSFTETNIYKTDDKGQNQPKDTAQDKDQSPEKHYHIKDGDNLTHIAKEQLGKDASEQEIQKYIKEIAKRNDIKDVNLIYKGDWLDLPEVQKNPEKAKPETVPEAAKDGKQADTPIADQQKNKPHEGSGDKQPIAKDNQAHEGSDDKQPIAKDNQPHEGSDNKQPTGGESPADSPPPPPETQGEIATTDKVEENPNSKAESPELTKEREHLSNLAQDKMNSVEYDKFSQQMTKLEARSDKLEEQYEKQGMPRPEAQKKAQEEIAKTYHETARLLEAKDNSNVPIDEKQRTALAKEIMSNAADPTTIRQGAHSTCNVTSVETRIYTKEPATAARLVADMATTGTYTGGDGTKVSLDKQSMHPDEDAKKKDSEHNRNFASQLFQITAVNMHYAKTDSGIRYEQHKTDKTLTPPDTGERLVDYSKNPPQDVTASTLDKWLTDITDETYHRPGLSNSQIAEVCNSITGKKETDLLLDTNEDSELTQQVKSAKELEDILLKAKEAGRLPLIVAVHTGNEPFLADSGDGTAGGSGGWHAVTITDIESGSPPKISIDNQWGKTADHTTDNKLSLNDLYGAMRAPGHPETIKALEEETKHNRETGKIDDFKELELLRLQHNNGTLSDEQYSKAYLSHMKESQERWHNIMSHGTNDMDLMKRIDKGRERQTALFLELPPDKRAEALRIEKETGFHAPTNYDNYFAFNIAKTRREFEKEQSDPKQPMSEERKISYQKAFHEMVTIMDSLPPDRQESIRNKAYDFSAPEREAKKAKAKSQEKETT